MNTNASKISRLHGIARTRDWVIGRHLHLPSLALRFSERKLLLAIVDLIIINLALRASLAIRAEISLVRWERPVITVWDQLGWYVLLSVLWLIVGSLLDIYDLARAASTVHSLTAAGGAAILTGAVYFFIPYFTPSFPVRRLEVWALPALATVGVGIWRLVYATVFVQPNFHQRALVIGAGWAGSTLAQAIHETGNGAGNPYLGTGYQIIGFVDDDEAKQSQVIEGIPVLGTRHDLARLARELAPNELIVAITDSGSIHGELFQAILDCQEMGIPVTNMTLLYERLTGRVPVEHAGRNLYVVLPMSRPAAHRFYLMLKRLTDILASLIGCMFMAALTPLVWLANQICSPGPLFYWQARIGKGGQALSVVKFRSMIRDAERDTGAVWASDNDCRVTPVGRFLRKTRLDEVPQFWNVLKGDMSLVGPRPERPEFVAHLAQEIPFYRSRHAVRPGITGWAQVKYRYGASVEDAWVKLQYDLYYIKYQNMLLDLQILLKTVGVVLGFKGQ